MPIVTWTLVAVTVIVSWIGFNNRRLVERLVFWPPALSELRQHDRLVGHGFVHADFGHLVFNMITLYFFGTVMEPVFETQIGKPGFALFYLLAIVAAILPSWARHRHDRGYFSLGASGGVAAILFSFILFAPWQTIYLFVIPIPAIVYAAMYTAYSLWAERRGTDNINHSAHLAGALFGVVATLAIEPAVGPHFLRELSKPF
jgi:membrane associated rhomboid family serine protease